MVAMASIRQENWRLYDSDAGEAASTPLEAEDTNHTLSVSADTSIQVRFMLDEEGGAAPGPMADWTLQYSKNGGTWTNVPTSDSGDGIRAATAGLTNDASTTNRATNGISDGTGSFGAGEQSTDGVVDDLDITASGFTEIVYGVEFVEANVANTDTFDFRVNEVDSSDGDPRVTISKSNDVSITGTTATSDLATVAATVSLDISLTGTTATSDLATNAATITYDVEVTGTTATSDLATYAATITRNVEVFATTATADLATNQATVDFGANVLATTATSDLATYAATIVYDVDVQASTATQALATYAATVAHDIGISATTATADLATYAATITLDVGVTGTTATADLATYAATVANNVAISATTATATLATYMATVALSGNTSITGTTATASLATIAASVTLDTDITATTATSDLATYAATITVDVEVTGTTPSLSLSTVAAAAILDLAVLADDVTFEEYVLDVSNTRLQLVQNIPCAEVRRAIANFRNVPVSRRGQQVVQEGRVYVFPRLVCELNVRTGLREERSYCAYCPNSDQRY